MKFYHQKIASFPCHFHLVFAQSDINCGCVQTIHVLWKKHVCGFSGCFISNLIGALFSTLTCSFYVVFLFGEFADAFKNRLQWLAIAMVTTETCAKKKRRFVNKNQGVFFALLLMQCVRYNSDRLACCFYALVCHDKSKSERRKEGERKRQWSTFDASGCFLHGIIFIFHMFIVNNLRKLYLDLATEQCKRHIPFARNQLLMTHLIRD